MREWREDVRLGIIRECSPWSRVAGLSDCLSRVRGRTKDVWSRNEGPIVVVVDTEASDDWSASMQVDRWKVAPPTLIMGVSWLAL